MQAILIASDHAGLDLKRELCRVLKAGHYPVEDLGPDSNITVDYPDYATKLAKELYRKPRATGILICGTGIGMSIAVNKYAFIRGALCLTPEMAKLARQHNDANVLILGARIMTLEDAVACMNIFLTTPFDGGRHELRVAKVREMTHDFEK